jgi:hypothetical protein
MFMKIFKKCFLQAVFNIYELLWRRAMTGDITFTICIFSCLTAYCMGSEVLIAVVMETSSAVCHVVAESQLTFQRNMLPPYLELMNK